MRNKNKLCNDCIFKMGFSGTGVTSNYCTPESICCGYSLITGETALKRGHNDTVIDTRGDDPNKCELRKTDGIRKKVCKPTHFAWEFRED